MAQLQQPQLPLGLPPPQPLAQQQRPRQLAQHLRRKCEISAHVSQHVVQSKGNVHAFLAEACGRRL